MKYKIAAFLLGLMLSLGFISSDVQATLLEIEKDWTLYGNLNQNHIPGYFTDSNGNLILDEDGNPISIGSMSCGPTATVNSFIYLQNKYPGIYDKTLVPDTNGNGVIDEDEMIAVAQFLSGANYMDLTYEGTYADNFIYGKWKYIEEVAQRSTIYHAQNYWDWTLPPVDQFYWVDQVIPTWDFIYDELKKCEDLEILINGDYDHYLTLTSFHWDDIDGDGIIDGYDTDGDEIIDSTEAWIDYIDPGTGLLGFSDIWQYSAMGFIYTNYGGPEYESYISMAVAESPVPEPATLLLLGIGLLGLAGSYRLRKRELN